MIEKFICLIFGHDWKVWRLGRQEMMRRCDRCRKFEFKVVERV